MFYRVVLQGRATDDHDLGTVQREFARVTGMPETVTERLFAQTPHQLKEGASKADAERIADTLRAIGAAVTVERDLIASLEAADGSVHELLAPAHFGPPTIVPGSGPAQAPATPTAAQKMRRRLRPYVMLLVGTPLAVVALVLLAPYVDDAVSTLVPVRVMPQPPAKPREAEAPVVPAPLNAGLLHGPWRCTDQRTGMSVYWTFGAEGALTYHGDTFTESATGARDPDTPGVWQLDGNRLVFTLAQKPPAAYTVSDLNLSRLRYDDGGNVDVECRRP
ncbi:MAG: hypothetical protein ABI593_02215 [Betaproteobacteria bacterium]